MPKPKLSLPLSVSLLLMLSVSAAAQTRQRTAAGQRTVDAASFPGADLGAKINAADRALGAGAGEIVVRGGGRITTQIVVSEGHTLRLTRGVYAPVTTEIPVLLKSGATIKGDGWETVLLESIAPGQFVVVSAYNGSRRNEDGDSDITVRDIQIKGANPGFNSAPQAVALGNCVRCTVDNVWVNATRSIGVQLGGSSAGGKWAEDSKVVNCLFTRVASQNLAMVNGRNILFENNRFIKAGQAGGPGSTNIDLEPNMATDRLENITIRNNFIDVRDSDIPTTGNGILVQSGSGTPHVGPILIEGNTVIGGSIEGTVTNVLSNGIYVFGVTMRDVTIRNNKVTRTGQAGIRIEGTRFTVTGNQFTDIGGGGIPGFYMAASDSRITNNTLRYSGNGPVDGRILLIGVTKGNVFSGNAGFAEPEVAR